MDSSNLRLQSRVHEPVSSQRRLLLELWRYDNGRVGLSATAWWQDLALFVQNGEAIDRKIELGR